MKEAAYLSLRYVLILTVSYLFISCAALMTNSPRHFVSARVISGGSTSTTNPSQMFHHPIFGSASHEADDDDDDEYYEKPYGNRSLAWTRRYRRLLPYQWARNEAMKLGLRTKEEWNDYLQDGVDRNKYLPNKPDEMYAEDWVSWEEFLGIMRTYEDTRHIVQNVLCLKSMEDYQRFISADVKRAEGLRIPFKPDIVYKDKGWIDLDHFFSVDEDAEDDGDYRCSM
ncbi:hypothetical protein MPSEU_000647400 [Mayamaea pseudoterrestris]|nr:hypothetical protein MPSEU_000647400 [Mayamaea pseudoterrestris]